jgi:hypothetical protein
MLRITELKLPLDHSEAELTRHPGLSGHQARRPEKLHRLQAQL